MLKKILIILIITIIIISTLTTIKISSKNNFIFKKIHNIINTSNKIIFNKNLNTDKNIIGKLIIKKLNINESLYKITSKENNVEKHITILKESILPDQDNSIIFLAAHSGTGKIAYFKDLNNLKINDEIIFYYKNITYKYYVKDIWEEKKNGFINVNKENTNQLILTTCSPTKNNYQLVINCIEKKS